MARPGLMRHRKFARLARLLGSEALARGHLELLWEVGYENGDDALGDAGDVEFSARWQGETGKLTAALLEAGFIDQDGDAYRIHDLWDHAPEYVRKRRVREAERQTKGAALRSVSAERQSVSGQCPPNGSQCPPNGRTRAPAPAPAPAHNQEALAADAARADEAEVFAFLSQTDAAGQMAAQSKPASKPKRERKPTNPRVGEVIALWCRLWADWKGDSYQVDGKSAGQAKALAGFANATDAEIERRFKRATLDPWFADKADLALFVSQWNKHGGGTVSPSAPAQKRAFDHRIDPDPYPEFDPDWMPPKPVAKAVTP